VNSYLDSTVDNVAERVWRDPRETPGDDRVRLLATRIVQNGRLAPILDINQSAQVEFEFEVLRTCKNLISGVNFQDATGTCLFVHCDWRPNEMRPGLYRKHVTLPPQIFAEGSVQVLVELVFHDPRVQSVFIPEAIGFEAVDSDVPNAVRGLYHGPWPGVMRLGLEWSDPELL
jgi:lipopolysaccharide transport system ATP-binding protein